MSKAGKIGRLTAKQTNREHFSDIPVGSRFVILEEVNLPAYDALACFFEHPPQILKNGERHWNGYLERGTYELVQ